MWIPRAIGIDGEIIRVFDPNHHEPAPLDSSDGLLSQAKFDARWIRVKRPTIIVGGELTMDHLELRLNTATNINEGPVQLKSNCGTLVIDDFGRQKMRTDELLNRWIVPLEKRYDFLSLPSGKSIQVPFDQLVIFSTNLEPKDLVDDAFLRRIPYKIEVENPTEEEFIELFRIMAPIMGFTYSDAPIRLPHRHTLQACGSTVSLLPASRYSVADQELVSVPRGRADSVKRGHRLCRRQLLCSDVGRLPTFNPEGLSPTRQS